MLNQDPTVYILIFGGMTFVGIFILLTAGVIFLHKKGMLFHREQNWNGIEKDDNYLLWFFAVIGLALIAVGVVLSIVQIYLAFLMR